MCVMSSLPCVQLHVICVLYTYTWPVCARRRALIRSTCMYISLHTVYTCMYTVRTASLCRPLFLQAVGLLKISSLIAATANRPQVTRHILTLICKIFTSRLISKMRPRDLNHCPRQKPAETLPNPFVWKLRTDRFVSTKQRCMLDRLLLRSKVTC